MEDVLYGILSAFLLLVYLFLTTQPLNASRMDPSPPSAAVYPRPWGGASRYANGGAP